MTQTLCLSEPDVNIALAQLEGEGLVLRGHFRPEIAEEEFCNRRILARIHRGTINRLRREVEPVPQATFIMFLCRWQNAEPAFQLRGVGGTLDIVEKLQGFEAATGSWEAELLATRISDYQPLFLDRLCLGGEVVWAAPVDTRTTAIPPRAGPAFLERLQ